MRRGRPERKRIYEATGVSRGVWGGGERGGGGGTCVAEGEEGGVEEEDDTCGVDHGGVVSLWVDWILERLFEELMTYLWDWEQGGHISVDCRP